MPTYIATRPRAQQFGFHGLFTDDGEEINLTNVSEELNLHHGNMWTAIISLRQEDVTGLGFDKEFKSIKKVVIQEALNIIAERVMGKSLLDEDSPAPEDRSKESDAGHQAIAVRL